MANKIPNIIMLVGLLMLMSCKGSIDHDPNPSTNLSILAKTNVPINDDYEVASRYRHIEVERDAAAHERVDYTVGDSRDFYVLDVNTNVYKTVKANLVYITPHLYFWVQQGINYEQTDVARLSETFENQIYPLNRAFFGNENSPGIDGDEHLSILYTSEMGLASGYFSSADINPREIEPYSNEAEIFMLSSLYTRLDEEYTYGVLAHEFQHMIHRNLDKNESSWINEGFSELASLLNGYDPGGSDKLYAGNPDIQLNFWPRDEVESTLPHYGASFLFMTYLYDRFGEEFSRALVSNPLNGFPSIDAVLAETVNEDGKAISLNGDDVFQDWTIANLIQNSTIEQGQYGYQNMPEELEFWVNPISDCSAEERISSVRQFGVDYYQILCGEPFHVQFKGQPTVAIVPVEPHSGNFYFWSNKGDQSAMTLTQTFDFREINAPITLSYYTWYDLEKDWDYVYLLAKGVDDEWEVLNPPGCTEENITGSNHGCGYNGISAGWMLEEVDLSQLAGEEVTLQFEYLTDTALNGEGFLIDDIKINAIGYDTDLEDSSGGWIGDGFVRISNSLPQTYAISFITRTDSEIQISKYKISGDDVLDIYGNPDEDTETYLIVSGTTRYTITQSDYSLSFVPDSDK